MPPLTIPARPRPARTAPARARRLPLAALLACWPPAPGSLELRAKPRDPNRRLHRAFFDPRDTARIAAWLARHQDWHLYFGIALRDGRGGRRENLTAIPALWADLDQPRVRLPKPVPPPTAIVATGRGAHLYWALTTAIPANPATLRTVDAILRGLAARLGADPAAAEAARTLRAPGTLNWKYTPPTPVRLIRLAPRRRYPIERFTQLAEPPRAPAPPAPRHAPPPPSDAIARLFAGCAFLRWARDHQAEVSEPLWLAALTNLAPFPGGARAAWALSRDYPRFQPREFAAKFRHARDDCRPHTCARIERLGAPTCATCPWRGRLRAPASLARRRTSASPP
jgi:hypothetical protein